MEVLESSSTVSSDEAVSFFCWLNGVILGSEEKMSLVFLMEAATSRTVVSEGCGVRIREEETGGEAKIKEKIA